MLIVATLKYLRTANRQSHNIDAMMTTSINTIHKILSQSVSCWRERAGVVKLDLESIIVSCDISYKVAVRIRVSQKGWQGQQEDHHFTNKLMSRLALMRMLDSSTTRSD